MKQLQPGMLALVINDQFMENVGRVVTVKEFRGRVTSTAHYGRSYDDGGSGPYAPRYYTYGGVMSIRRGPRP